MKKLILLPLAGLVVLAGVLIAGHTDTPDPAYASCNPGGAFNPVQRLIRGTVNFPGSNNVHQVKGTIKASPAYVAPGGGVSEEYILLHDAEYGGYWAKLGLRSFPAPFSGFTYIYAAYTDDAGLHEVNGVAPPNGSQTNLQIVWSVGAGGSNMKLDFYVNAQPLHSYSQLEWIPDAAAFSGETWNDANEVTGQEDDEIITNAQLYSSFGGAWWPLGTSNPYFYTYNNHPYAWNGVGPSHHQPDDVRCND